MTRSVDMVLAIHVTFFATSLTICSCSLLDRPVNDFINKEINLVLNYLVLKNNRCSPVVCNIYLFNNEENHRDLQIEEDLKPKENVKRRPNSHWTKAAANGLNTLAT